MKSVFIIGCGAVGRSLGRALADTGRYRISGVHDSSEERAAAAGADLGAESTSGDLPERTARAEIVIAAAPSCALGSIAALASSRGRCAEHQVWLHCDGGVSHSVLAALAPHVLGVGTLHPARVFPPNAISTLSKTDVFALTGDPIAVETAAEIARDLGCRSVRIDAEARAAYHAAAVMASNYAVALLAESRDLLVSSCDLSSEDAEHLVLGLASSAVEAASSLGLEASLSGPIRRGDIATVRRHLEELGAHPSALGVYRTLGRAALEVARRIPSYSEDAAEEISRALVTPEMEVKRPK